MAAGLGFKTFTTGEVLTAADTNGYLMQGVLVFASAAARDAAITSPQEGQCCYLKDTDAVLTYSGAAWVGFDDSNAIQNTIVDAKGDLITATAADTPARLAVGTNAQVLTADSTTATGLKWATPASGGGMTLLSTTSTTTGSSYTVSSISQDYINLLLIWQGLSCTAGAAITLTFAGGDASIAGVNQDATTIVANAAAAKLMPDTQASGNAIACTIFNYTAAAAKNLQIAFGGVSAGYRGGGYQGAHHYTSAISTFTVTLSTGSFSAGSLKVYGVK